MTVSPLDSELYDWKFSTDGMRRIWDDESLVANWLRVEATLAECQADLGIIPTDAAEAIAEHATTDSVNLSDIASRFRKTNLDSTAMIQSLTDAVPDHASEYVHWGATTTDITETGLSLQLRHSIDLLDERLTELTAVLIDLAETHKETVMVARTHSQHALPTTFGLKVATWALEVHKEQQKLLNVRERVCVGKITGAAGTYAAFGGQGRELEERVCEELGLEPADITIQSSQTRLKDYLHALAGIATTCQHIAKEIWNRQRTEIGELHEQFVVGENTGSSTLAFKRNPFECEWIRSVADLVKHQANAIRDLQMEDERDGMRFAYYRALVPSASVMTDSIVSNLIPVISNLRVDTEAMRSNLDKTSGFAMSENVMMAMATRGAGKQTAHEIIYDCATLAFEEGLSLSAALRRDGRVFDYIDEDELETLTDPEEYLGDAVALTEETLAQIRRAS